MFAAIAELPWSSWKSAPNLIQFRQEMHLFRDQRHADSKARLRKWTQIDINGCSAENLRRVWLWLRKKSMSKNSVLSAGMRAETDTES